ncbi:MAG: ABC transporter ATP-binding protein [Candidatus Hodarchaeales archaeon]
MIELENVSRVYKMGGHEIHALKDISLKFESGKLVVVLGPSGSGKTTLLNVLGAIDNCTSGKIVVNGLEITSLSKNKRTEYRRNKCGFIFQFFNLLPVYNALENVEYAVELASTKKISKKEVTSIAEDYLKRVNLFDKKDLFPSQLSGGEQQRVAAARAFAKNPQILLCDEPTGELSVKEGQQVLSVIQDMINERDDLLVLLVTHNQKIAQIADVVIRLRSGEIDSVKTQTPVSAKDIIW